MNNTWSMSLIKTMVGSLVAVVLIALAGSMALAQPGSPNPRNPGFGQPPMPPAPMGASGAGDVARQTGARQDAATSPAGGMTGGGMASGGVAGDQAGGGLANRSAAASAANDYQLGPADRLRIIVFGEESLSGEFTVAGNGNISLPLIGDIRAAGGTVRDFQDKVQTALRDGYLKDPRVSAEVLSFRPYYMLGEVARPGIYPYIDGITVLNAIATAGGFSYRANRHYVFIKDSNQTKERRMLLTDALKLNPGDRIRIGERLF